MLVPLGHYRLQVIVYATNSHMLQKPKEKCIAEKKKKSKRITSLEFIRTNSGEWNTSLHSIPQSMDNLGKHLSLKRLKNLKQTSNDPQQLCSILQIFLLNSSRFYNRTVTKTSMFFCLKICP